MLSNKVKVIANAFIKSTRNHNKGKPFRERILFSIKRLQKLLFFCEIEYMKKHEGKQLFEEEFYAWPSGPVIPAVYHDYMLYSDDCSELPCVGQPTEEEQTIIYKVFNLTAKLDTVDLVNACSALGSPWIHVFDVDDKEHKQVVSKSEIFKFYSRRDLKNDILKLREENKEVIVVSPSDIGLCDGTGNRESRNEPVIIIEP